MKCIGCDTDVRLRDRADGKCPACKGRFAFEPRKGDPFTDRGFLDAIEALSGTGRLRWGVENLYWELARRRSRKMRGSYVGCSVVLGILTAVFAFVGFSAEPGFGVAALVALGFFLWLVLWLRLPGRSARELPVARFNGLWQRWVEAHEHPATAIRREGRPRERSEPAEVDLYDYSFDRVVVCDRARTVDLLVANNFHFENNCAVLSIAGYPEAVFEPVRAMLKRNPQLEVFALHDATPFGCRMAERLSTDPAWFPGHGQVVDVGLRPRHVLKQRAYWLASEVRDVTPGGGLSRKEAAWLSRYRVELAVYRPEAILKALFRAINRREEMVMAATAAAAGTDSGDDVGFDSFG